MRTSRHAPPIEAIQLLRKLFDLRELHQIWKEIEPRNYPLTLHPVVLIQCLFGAMVLHLSSLKRVIRHYPDELGTKWPSTLSEAVRRVSVMWLARRMLLLLQERDCPSEPQRDDVVLLDSMRLDISSGRSSDAQRINDECLGGGMICGLNTDARRGHNPIELYKVLDGCWNDTYQMRSLKLIPNGPIYVVDCGAYGFTLLNQWNKQQIRYIMRAKRQNFCYEVLQVLSQPTITSNGVRIELDAVVRLGSPNNRHTKNRPIVRLVKAWRPEPSSAKKSTHKLRKGKKKNCHKKKPAKPVDLSLFVVSNPIDIEWPAEFVLKTYKRRRRIEDFFRMLKNQVGLAHLYNFQRMGMRVMLYLALIVAIATFLLDEQHAEGDSVSVLLAKLKHMHDELGVETPWQRNIPSPKRAKRQSRASPDKANKLKEVVHANH